MTASKLLVHQVRLEQRAFWRNPEKAFFTFVLPLGLLLIFGATMHRTLAGMNPLSNNVSLNTTYGNALTAMLHGLLGPKSWAELVFGVTFMATSGFVVGALTVVSGIEHLHAANRVFPQLPLPPKEATDLANHETLHGTAATVGYVAAAAGLALAFAVGMVSMNARRAGLLSGFMGVLGVIVGVLLVLGGLLGMPPIVQYFWVTALGLLFLNRWPGQQGRGPAWDSGEEEPWPTAAELRAERTASGLKSDGRDRPPPSRGRAPEPVEEEYEADGGYEDEAEEPQPGASPHPRSKKRKRKRRR